MAGGMREDIAARAFGWNQGGMNGAGQGRMAIQE
jgi:hypothetical protein